jgi:hypothetical protein
MTILPHTQAFLAAQSLQMRKFQEQFQKRKSVQLYQLQEEHSIHHHHNEEAHDTHNQQIKEEWTKILEQQQLIYAMLASILQPNAATTPSHLPLTMTACSPPGPHNEISQSPDCSMSFAPIALCGTAKFTTHPLSHLKLFTPPKFCLPTRLHSEDNGVAPPPETEAGKNPCHFVLVVSCRIGISPIT